MYACTFAIKHICKHSSPTFEKGLEYHRAYVRVKSGLQRDAKLFTTRQKCIAKFLPLQNSTSTHEARHVVPCTSQITSQRIHIYFSILINKYTLCIYRRNLEASLTKANVKPRAACICVQNNNSASLSTEHGFHISNRHARCQVTVPHRNKIRFEL